MARVKIGLAAPDPASLEAEIAQLRDLDLTALRARWRTVFRRSAPPHLSRHLLFRMLAYRLQAERLGDLDAEARRQIEAAGRTTDLDRLAADLSRQQSGLRPGTVLTRDWGGQMHHVMVLPVGFSWNGQTYPSLSKVASAITGTRWNGPRFFGLRDKRVPEAAP